MALPPTFSKLSSGTEEESGICGQNYKEDFQIICTQIINFCDKDVIVEGEINKE